MTANIEFDGFYPVKPSSLKWKCHVDNYTDTATIVLPAMCRFKDADKPYQKVPTGQVINEGTHVKIYAGYDGFNSVVFEGFVSRINFRVPVEIECEGYSYQLKRKVINKSFSKTTVKEVIQYLIEGTDIKLSTKMPERIIFSPMTFKNYTAFQVLDFLKEKYLLTIFFFYNEIYAGWRSAYKGRDVKFRLRWNVVNDESLLFNTYNGSVVHISLVTREQTGVKKKKTATNISKPGDVKEVKTLLTDDNDKINAANDFQNKNDQKGYRGELTGFLRPFVRPGDSISIIDNRYAERNGTYFCPGVEGSFSNNGGRQRVEIEFKL